MPCAKTSAVAEEIAIDLMVIPVVNPADFAIAFGGIGVAS
jgi:hypothetical protein